MTVSRWQKLSLCTIHKESSSEASPTIWSCYANLNHYSCLWKLIPHTVYGHRKICMTEYLAGFAIGGDWWFTREGDLTRICTDKNQVSLKSYFQALDTFAVRSRVEHAHVRSSTTVFRGTMGNCMISFCLRARFIFFLVL